MSVMKIVISPAKSLDFETAVPTEHFTIPDFKEEALRIQKVLSKRKPRSLSKLMEISDELAQLNWERNQKFELQHSPKNSRQAVFAFAGDVYQGLDPYRLGTDKLDDLQERLRILSGLYGLLKPLDLIQPYRLEMGTSLKIGRRKNLYDFWKKTVTAKLNSEMEEGEMLVNLASNEYFKVIDQKSLHAKVVTPQFKDWKNDKLKVLSFFAKKARGAMVKYIVESNAMTIDDLRGFDYDDYVFSKEHTLKENQPVFVR